MSARPPKPKVVAVGEVLWDLLPSGKQLGGAPANFAFHAHGLGAAGSLITRVGEDPLGREILECFRRLGLTTDCVTVDPAAPTGTVSVELAADGQPRYTIHEQVAWDHIEAEAGALAVAQQADAICFGSLAQRAEPSRGSIRRLVAATPARALRIFDINLRQQFYSKELLETSLGLANVLKLNDAELPIVAGLFKVGGGVEAQLAELAHRFDLRLAALTRGGNGSLLFSDGCSSEHPGLRVPVRDTIGAGDAFTAAMALGFMAGWPLEQINQRANEVAAFVCTQAGGTPSLPEDLQRCFQQDKNETQQ